MWNWTGPDSNSPAPPGVVPNYSNPIDVAWTRNVAIIIVCVALVTIFFVIRIYVKVYINPKILADDYTCAIAYCLIILYSLTVFMSTSSLINILLLIDLLITGKVAHYGEGYNSWEIRIQEYYNLLKWLYASTVVYCPAAYFTKVTILLLMARVFAVEERLAKGIYIFIWALLVAYIPIQIIKTIVCIPIRSLWDPTVQHVHCEDQRKIFFGDVALAILTDTIILLVPIFPTWKLHMPLRKKIKIVALLGAGGAATATTIFRTYKVAQFVNSNNLTVDYVDIDILTCIELTIGFVCACLPSLNLLLQKQSGRSRSDSERRNPTSCSRMKNFLRRSRTPRTSQSNGPGDSNTPVADERPALIVNFDIELAMFTGQPLEIDPSRSGEQANQQCRRVSSSEGLREGWLSHIKRTNQQCQNTEFIMRMVERSRLAGDQWPQDDRCPVWDGPRHYRGPKCKGSKLYSLEHQSVEYN